MIPPLHSPNRNSLVFCLMLIMLGLTDMAYGQNNVLINVTDQQIPGLPQLSNSAQAWGDYDGDSLPDLLIIGQTADNKNITRLYHNMGTKFEDISSLFTPSLPQVSNGSAAWGDYDNDGKLDLFISGDQGNFRGISKLYRNKGGSFEDKSDAIHDLPNVYNSSAAWGDYDKNGHLDLMLIGLSYNEKEYDSKYVSILFNNDGSKLEDGSSNLPDLPKVANGTITWIDYNQDGNLDLMLTGQSANGPVSKLYRNGIGKYYPNVNTIFEDRSKDLPDLPQVANSAVGWAHYNKDVLPDLMITGQLANGKYISKFYSHASASGFEDVSDQVKLPGVSAGTVAWGDYDNDGRQDLMITGDNNGKYVSRLYHSTTTGFVDVSTLMPNLPQVGNSSAAWGDYDNDNKLDLMLIGDLGGTNKYASKLYRYNGNGFDDATSQLQTFIKVGNVTTTVDQLPMAYGSVSWVDNNFGKKDLMVTGNAVAADPINPLIPPTIGPWNIYYLNRPVPGNKFGFVDRSTSLPATLPQLKNSSVAWADFDKDSIPDMLIIGETKDETPVSRLYRGIAPNQYNQFYEDKTGLLAELQQLPLSNGTVAWGDYDGDTWPDLVITGLDKNDQPHTLVYQNQKGQGFKNITPLLPGLPHERGGTVAWGDYDRDGRMDLLVISGVGTNAVSKLYHSTHATSSGFEDKSDLLPGLPSLKASSVAFGDYDNDKFPDLIITGNDGNHSVTKLYHNTGAVFKPASDQLPNLPDFGFGSVAWGDYDGDTRVDLLLSGRTANGAISKLYQNTIDGFIDQSTLIPNLVPASASINVSGVSEGSAAWIDYDHDKKLDLFLTGDATGAPVSKLFRNANLDMSTTLQGLAGLSAGSAAWGDYDNDGKLDLFISGESSDSEHSSKLYRNTGSGFKETLLRDLPQLSSSAAAWGDYDNDGRLDLIITGLSTSNYITRLYHNTGSDFEDKTPDKMPNVGRGSVAWGDYDNDGRLDLILMGESGAGYVSKLYHNTGSGFEEAPSHLIPDLPQVSHSSTTWIDYDRDGKLDLFLMGLTKSGPVRKLFHNTGSGFEEKPYVLDALPPLLDGSVAWGDYNNDGWPDLIATGLTDANLSITKLLQNAKGNEFVEVSNPLQPLATVSQGSAAFGDYDNDGRLDLVITGNAKTGPITKLYHNTAVGFVDVSNRIPSLPNVQKSSVAWADYDNDGKLDLWLMGSTGSARISKLFHNPVTVANTPPTAPTGLSSQFASDGKSAKFNWQASTDDQTPQASLSYNLYVSDTPGGQNVMSSMANLKSGYRRVVQLGNSQPTSYTLTGLTPGKTYYWSVQAIDQIFAGSPFAPEQKLGASLFVDQTDLLPGLPPLDRSAHAWGDYDNDGKLDLIITGQKEGEKDPNQSRVSKLYHNLGDRFEEQPSASSDLPNLSYGSVAWADYDNDGRLDLLLTGDSGAGYVSKLYHNENGAFKEQLNRLPGLPGLTYSAMAWADYDQDGKADLIITGGDGQTAISQLYHNTGQGFERADSLLPNRIGLWRSAVAWGDYDRDGKPDLLLTGLGTDGKPHRLLYHNTGKGFEDASNSWLADMPGVVDGAVAFGDFDQDGWLDLVVTGNNTENFITKLYHNTSQGFDDLSSLDLPGLVYSSVAWGDYDNDGKLDLLLTGYNNADYVTKLYHSENGGFVDLSSSLLAPGVSRGGVSWSDYDNDGRLDLLLTGYSGEKAVSALYHNGIPVANTLPTAPGGMNSQVLSGGQSVKLNWQAATDAQTPAPGLNYNLYVSDTPGGQNVLSPMADQKTGYRRVVQLGNSQATNFTITGLTPGKTYYWSVQAIDGAFAGSPFAPEQSFITSQLGDAEQPLKLIAPLYNCQSGAFTFQTTGGDGSLIEYNAPGITSWTSNSRQYVDTELRQAADAQPITLVVRQSGKEVRYVFDIRAICPAGDPAQFRLVAPLYDCQTGGFSFRTQGGDGSPIEYMAAGITSWTSDPFQVLDDGLRTSADVKPLELRARQGGNEVRFVWDIRAICPVEAPGQGLGSPQSQSFEDVSSLLSSLPAMESPSIAWGDYDNDGQLDLFITGKANTPISKLYRNTGNGFEDQSSLLPGLPQVSSSSVAWTDYDNDGRLDLMITGLTTNNAPVSKLYHNTGTGFEDQTSLIPGQPQVGNGAVAFGDYDHDGRADFILTGRSTSGAFSKLYRNIGSGFEDRSSLLPGLPALQLSAVAFGDYDNDGQLDLMLTGIIQSNTAPYVSKLYHNTGKGFEDASDQLPELVGLAAGSVTWNDFDNDGRLDLLLTGTNGGTRYTTRLYRNTDYGFEDASHFPGIYLGSAAWGDYDNDGLKDLMLTGVTTTGYSSKLYRNTGRGFADASDQLPGLPQMGYNAVGWADYDNDGKLDLLMTGYTSSDKMLKLYHNISPVANTPPTPPSELISRTSTRAVQLVWDQGTDAQTPKAGLNYNLYVSDKPGSQNVVSSLADLNTGYLRVVQPGNSQTRTITLTGLEPNKTYYWSVQAVDGAFAGSTFAPEQSFTTSAGARLGMGQEPGVGLQAEVYPNPVESELTVRIEGAQDQSVELQLMNLTGQVVQARKLNVIQPTQQERLRVEGLPSGLYLLRVSTAQQKVTLKVIKR